MEIIKHHDEIWEIKNFLTSEEIEYLNNFIKEVPESDWENDNRHYHLYKSNKNYRPVIENIENKILNFFDNVSKHIDIQDFQRLKNGMYVSAHVDVDHSERQDDIRYGIVLYLNEDYTGGELHYIDLGYKIKPKTGSAFIHSKNYLHEVVPVIEGIRYMLTIFVIGNDSTKFKF